MRERSCSCSSTARMALISAHTCAIVLERSPCDGCNWKTWRIRILRTLPISSRPGIGRYWDIASGTQISTGFKCVNGCYSWWRKDRRHGRREADGLSRDEAKRNSPVHFFGNSYLFRFPSAFSPTRPWQRQASQPDKCKTETGGNMRAATAKSR